MKKITFRGEKAIWEQLEHLGGGDAGEAYLVRNQNSGVVAVLKRPTSIDASRQAPQIEQEGNILRLLDGVKFVENNSENKYGSFKVRAVRLLDNAPKNTQKTSSYFIVTELARGFDLRRLGEVRETRDPGKMQEPFLMGLAELDDFPSLLLYRAAYGVASYLHLIYRLKPEFQIGEIAGVVWNDIKPDHIFWDPIAHEIMLIDWGNSQFLGQDGVSLDRGYSADQDWGQYVKMFNAYFERYGKKTSSRIGCRHS